MPETLTATYSSIGQANNAADDLISTGIDADKVFVDAANKQVKVMVPRSVKREVEEILQRHDPTEIVARPVPG